jgi:hypothetical protein
MRSIISVTTPATTTKLTTLDRVKAELSITNNSQDIILNAKIDEASEDAEASLGFRVPRETVSETFWHSEPMELSEYLVLDRAPVVSIDSVIMDGDIMDPSLYRLDAARGLLYAMNPTGYACYWYFTQSIVVNYIGGYLLPGQGGRDLPAGIEGAVVELVTDYWSAKGRDPSVKSEEIPGVLRRDYWVGAVGEEGELPPRVVMKLAPFRRVQV